MRPLSEQKKLKWKVIPLPDKRWRTKQSQYQRKWIAVTNRWQYEIRLTYKGYSLHKCRIVSPIHIATLRRLSTAQKVAQLIHNG